MAFLGPPPVNAEEWPFSCLLEFCIANGVGNGRDPSSTPWTAKSLAQMAEQFSNKAVEAWMQAANLPSMEALQSIIETICRNEPIRFRNAWKREIAASHANTSSIEPSQRKPNAQSFREGLIEKTDEGENFRVVLRAVGERLRSTTKRHIMRLVPKHGNGPNETVSHVARIIAQAKKAREQGELSEAQTLLNEANTDLSELVEEAYAIINAYSVLKGETGELNYEQEKFENAAEDFFRSILYLPRESNEERRLERRFWFAANKAISASSDFKMAKKLYRRSQRVRMRADQTALTTLISKSKTFDEARTYFAKLERTNAGADIYAYTALIGKAPSADKVLELLREMKNKGIPPNTATFNTILSKSKSAGRRNLVISQMRNEGLKPDIVTYGILMEKASSYEEGKRIFNDMRSAGIQPNEYVAASFIKPISKFEQAVHIIKGLVAGGTQISEPVVVELTKKTTKLDQLLECLNWQLGLSKQLTIVTYNSALKRASEFKDAKIIADLAVKRDLSLDGTSYAELMNKTTNYEDCKSLLDEMTEREIPPSKITYNVILNKAWHKDQVSEVLANMSADGIKPTAITIGTMVNKAATFEHAREILEFAYQSNVPANDIILNTALKKTSSLEQAVSFLDTYDQYGVRPDAYSLSELVKKSGSFEVAVEHIEKFANDGILPNTVVSSNLKAWLTDYDQYVSMRGILKKYRIPLGGDEDLALLKNTPDFESAFATLRKLHENNTNLTHRGIELVLGRAGTYEQSDKVFSFMNGIGVKASTKHYASLIRTLPRLQTHNQNMTVAARAIADRKTLGHLSKRVEMRRQSLRRPNILSIRLRRL